MNLVFVKPKGKPVQNINEQSSIYLGIKIDIKHFIIYLFVIVFILSFNSLIMKLNPSQHKFISNLFDVDKEMNIPTYFSSLILLFSSFLFLIIAKATKKGIGKYYINWLFLSLVFFCLSADEFMSLHEQVSHFFRGTKVGNYIHFGWIIPASIFLLLFTVSYMKFFFHLTKRFKILFLLSAAVYVSGSIGMELIGGIYQTYFGQMNFIYYVLTDIEETFEMAGIVLLIYSLLTYIKIMKTKRLYN